MRKATLVATLVAILSNIAVAQGETYPSRPITMMVGYPPGGPTDTLARILGDAMGHFLGQTIVIETVSGASGTIATGRVRSAAVP
jgi:tripartite-type tricarboxylate transporter receptor subunit TctC